jgi:hypothetical protein
VKQFKNVLCNMQTFLANTSLCITSSHAGLQASYESWACNVCDLLLVNTVVQVASEDTVLYTLCRYLDRLSAAQREHARHVLAPLIRCQHLSQYWLTSALDSTHATEYAVLADLHPLLMRLLVLRSAQAGAVVQALDLQRLLPGSPPSWLLGPRISSRVSSVSVDWDLDISKLRETAQRCVAEGKLVKLMSHMTTPPLGGFSYKVGAVCRPVEAGAEVELFASCNNLAAGCLCPAFKCQLVSAGGRQAGGTSPVGTPAAKFGRFLKLGVMAGGWDAAVWAANGLPADGVLPVTLTVSEMAHMQRVPAPAQAPVGWQRQ